MKKTKVIEIDELSDDDEGWEHEEGVPVVVNVDETVVSVLYHQHCSVVEKNDLQVAVLRIVVDVMVVYLADYYYYCY